jgi:hypothetical protein
MTRINKKAELQENANKLQGEANKLQETMIGKTSTDNRKKRRLMVIGIVVGVLAALISCIVTLIVLAYTTRTYHI